MHSNKKGNLIYFRFYVIGLKEHILIITLALCARFFLLQIYKK